MWPVIRLDRRADGFQTGLPSVAMLDRDCGTGVKSVKIAFKTGIEPGYERRRASTG